MDLNGKVIVVTGGARGLGLAMAKSLAAKGASIALLDMNEQALADTCHSLPNARQYLCDVASETAVDDTFQQIVRDFGHIDGLINNAGIIRDGLMVKGGPGNIISELSWDDWQAVINVNLSGVFLCGRAAARHMVVAGNRGLILNVSSISAGGNYGQSNYSAAKAGVESLTKVWSKELSKHGIRCVAIAPGFIDTEMLASMNQQAKAKFEALIPVGRLGQPDEVGQLVCHLFENDYLNGGIYKVHGGLDI